MAPSGWSQSSGKVKRARRPAARGTWSRRPLTWRSHAASPPADRLALGFHIAITHATTHVACEICEREGLDTVALSGGVFMNRLLLQLLTHELKDAGLAVLAPHAAPVNDGCIAYGQAAIARARLAQTASR